MALREAVTTYAPYAFVFFAAGLAISLILWAHAKILGKAHEKHLTEYKNYWQTYCRSLQEENDRLSLDVERMSSRNSILAGAVREDALSKALTTVIPESAVRAAAAAMRRDE
jgi:hypothetical protein